MLALLLSNDTLSLGSGLSLGCLFLAVLSQSCGKLSNVGKESCERASTEFVKRVAQIRVSP